MCWAGAGLLVFPLDSRSELQRHLETSQVFPSISEWDTSLWLPEVRQNVSFEWLTLKVTSQDIQTCATHWEAKTAESKFGSTIIHSDSKKNMFAVHFDIDMLVRNNFLSEYAVKYRIRLFLTPNIESDWNPKASLVRYSVLHLQDPKGVLENSYPHSYLSFWHDLKEPGKITSVSVLTVTWCLSLTGQAT